MQVKLVGSTLLVASMLAVGLVGCAASDGQTSTEESAELSDATLPEQNRTLWVMPLDQYMVTQSQVKREAYLHALLSQSCISEQGFEHTVPSPNLSDDSGFGVRNRFDPGVASEFGYHSPVVVTDADDAWTEYTRRPMSDDELQALDGCVRDVMADSSVPKWTSKDLDYAPGIAQAAVLGAVEDATVSSAAEKWIECMAPLGISDLPASPSEMPSESMRASYGWATFAEVDSTPPITPAEIADAEFDAGCRETSGYSEALYQAEWSRQVELLKSNEAALEDLYSTITETDAAMIEQVASLAPKS